MIITAIFNFSYFLISAILNLLGTGGNLPEVIHTSAIALGGYVGMLNPIFPIDTLAIALGIAFSVEIAIFGFKTLKSFATHLPFIGGHK